MVGPPESKPDGDDLDLLRNKYVGESAAIIAPGISLEKESIKEYQNKVLIGINDVAKLINLDYLVVRDCDKIDSISHQFERREGMVLICNEGVYNYVLWNPIQSRFMGEDIKDRFAKLSSFFVDKFEGGSLAYALDLCLLFGIEEATLYGVDFYYRRTKRSAHHISKSITEDTQWVSGMDMDEQFTCPRFEDTKSWIEKNSARWAGMEVRVSNRKSRLECFK